MSLGAGEIAIIFVLVLVLFGPHRLPELARGLGKGMRELRKATSEIQQQLSLIGEHDENDWKKRERPVNTRLPSAAEAYSEAGDEIAAETGTEEHTAGAQVQNSETDKSEQTSGAEHKGDQRKENSATFEL